MTEREALKLALEAYLCREMPAGTVIGDPKWWVPKIANAIKEALASHIPDATKMVAQPEQIAVCIGYWNQKTGAYYKPDQISASHQKLIEDGILRRCYTTPPPQRTWVGLTDEEIIKCTPTWGGTVEEVARTVEAKLKEKNRG